MSCQPHDIDGFDAQNKNNPLSLLLWTRVIKQRHAAVSAKPDNEVTGEV